MLNFLKKNIPVHSKISAFAVKILVLIFLLFTPLIVQAQEVPFNTPITLPNSNKQDNPSQKFDPSKPVLSGGVSESQYLPDEMYGTWQIAATLISSSAPSYFKPRNYAIWILQQMGDRIQLANPDTGSYTFITVNEVVNNTATFTCISIPDQNTQITERVTITVNGDKFSGNNVYYIQFFRKNKPPQVFQALFTITAERIKGPKPQIFK